LKKIIPFLALCTLLLCSCGANHSENVYFIHAVSFVNDGGKTVARFLTERQSEDEQQNYFIAEIHGNSIDDTAQQMSSKYDKCYFATTELYFIDTDCTENFITELSSVCENSLLPSAARILCVKEEDLPSLLSRIKNENDLKRILKLTKKNKVNTVRFFAKCLSDSETVSVDSLKLDSNGKIALGKSFVFPLRKTKEVTKA